MKTAFFGVCASLILSVSAAAESLIDKAETFFLALEQEDIKTVETMIADDIMFEDPTWGTKVEGKAGVLKVYENYTGGARNMRKVRTEAYESAGTVFLNYIYHVEMNVAAKGKPANFIPVMGRGGRLVTFNKDGKVARHTDFADYGAVAEAMKAASQ
ncbi:MAG: nuclear transport factor 2 family protein [Alphaproteobacteria bacterium]|nr:nuclear transport factor 2 family protein [Alphaproteobacteria bacterium]